MFHGLKGPQSGRTSRTQAEAIGTDPEGFKEDPPYDMQGGHPVTKDLPKGEYKEAEMKEAGGAKPLDVAVPFTLTK